MTTQPANAWHEAPDEATYNDVGNEIDRLYGLEEFAAAYELLEATWPGLPGETMHPRMQDPLLFKAYILTHLDRFEETLEIIRTFHRLGYSCGLSWSAFDGIRALEGYDEVERTNDRLIAEAKAETKLEYDVFLPEGHDAAKAYPLALILHGDGGSRTSVRTFWHAKPLLDRGFIVAYVQSSQLVFTAHYAWLPDPAIAWKDVREAHERIRETHRVDETSLILCGFSGGAITAVDLVFGEALPVTGFICLCPEITPEHFTPESVTRAAARGVRGAFLEGALVWPLDDEQEMVDQMNAAGLPLEIIVNEGYGHAPPLDFEQKFRQALDFVLR